MTVKILVKEGLSMRGHLTMVSRETMAKILSAPVTKYDAKKAEKEARKNLRRQGLKV